MNSLRVGIIGLGTMGKHHLRIISNLNGVDLIGVMEPTDQKYLSSLEDMIKLKPDYCVIAVPTTQHFAIASSLIEAGIHFLVEKPVTYSAADALSLQQMANENNVVGGVGHIERYNSALIEAKKLIDTGMLGNVYQISTRRIGPFPPRIVDVGVAKDLATHDFHLTAWLMGSKYKKIFAQVSHKSGHSHEDLVLVSGTLENNVVVSHNVNWLSPLKERKVIITAENGSFVIDTLRSDLVHYVNGVVSSDDSFVSHFRGVTQGNIVNLAFAKKEALQAEHENFRDYIRDGSGHIVTLEEGFEALRVAELTLESSRSGSALEL